MRLPDPEKGLEMSKGDLLAASCLGLTPGLPLSVAVQGEVCSIRYREGGHE